ncbi:hypothetical protein IT411_00565, partial [Candidatus Peregrinibacteria bacterium]|nr:hypothetical protein [Candidatus Peregrinibacteria bacterium]
MRPFDKNHLNLKNCLGLQSSDAFLEKRLAFDEKSPEGPQVPEKPVPTIDVNSADFDNKAFQTEKFGQFNTEIKYAINEALKSVPELKDRTQDIERIQTDYLLGLSEKVLENKPSIAEAIKEQSASLYAEKDNLTKDNSADWFSKVLQNLKCNKIGIVHDNTDDKTKLRFYSEKGEILFKETDIKIEYVPKVLSEKASREKKSNEAIDIKLKGAQAISQEKFIKEYLTKPPVEGDRVVVDRYPLILKATYKKLKNDKEPKFYTEDDKQLYLIGGDKVKYYPKAAEKPTTFNEIKVGDTNYIVLTQIDTDSSYLEVARAVRMYESGKGAVVDGKQIMDDYTAARVAATNISVSEYAELLKKAHETVGKSNRLPIVLPVSNIERKGLIQKDA